MNKNVKEFCKTYKLTVDQFYGREEFKDNLYLNCLTELPEGFSPTVCGYLYLNRPIEVPEGFNPNRWGKS